MSDLQHDPGAGDRLVEPNKPNRRRRITALAVAGGVLAIGGGIGAASLAQADPTPTPTPSASSQPGQPGQGPRGDRGDRGPGGFGHGPRGGGFLGGDVKELAAKLGVTEAKLTEALKAIREENKPAAPSASPSASPSTSPSAPTTRPDPSEREAAFVKALAAKLGLEESKVKAAVDAVKAEHQADRAKALKTKLDAAVKAGTLTQAEANAVTKAVEKGVIHG